MRRLRRKSFCLALVALAMALPAQPTPPQPGLPILSQPGPTSDNFRLEAGKAYAIDWLQQGTFLNVTISLGISKGLYRAYLTDVVGGVRRLIGTAADGPPASGAPLFQVAKLDPGTYSIVVVRRGEDTEKTTWDVAAFGQPRLLGASVVGVAQIVSATVTTGEPYQANFTPFPIANNARPRFFITAQWTHNSADAYGPNSWGFVGPPAETCGFTNNRGTFRFGQAQSPIDITRAGSGFNGSQSLTFNYGTGLPFLVENLGNTIEVPGDNGAQFYLTYNGDRFNLLQFHVHAPSEHTLESQAFDMEVHLVHQNALGQLAVVGVLLNKATNASRSGLDTLIENAPQSVGVKEKADQTIAVDFVPTAGNFYFYNGSLTTPPCTEGVLWMVAADTKTILPATVDSLHNLIKKFPSYNNYENNNRPVVEGQGHRTVLRLKQ
jgi:carbonic anhydrase